MLTKLISLSRGRDRLLLPGPARQAGSGVRVAALTVENVGRQLDTAAKRELINAALAQYPEESHNKIAGRLGVSDHYVARVCAAMRRKR